MKRRKSHKLRNKVKSRSKQTGEKHHIALARILGSSSRTNEIHAWCFRLLDRWRARWESAPPGVRTAAELSLSNLTPPVQISIWTRSSSTVPIEANLVLIRRDPSQADGKVDVTLIGDESGLHGDLPWEATRVDATWKNMRQNWHPGRHADPPPEAWHIPKQRISKTHDCFLWDVPGKLEALEVEKLVDFVFKVRATNPEQRSTGAPERVGTHLHALGMRREFNSLTRWLACSAGQLLGALGVRGPFWCAINVPRNHLFEKLSGDFDFIGGPLELSVDPVGLEERVRREAESWPLTTPRNTIVGFAIRRAFEDGLVIWPPRIETIVACEAKASWYEPEAGIWKATHMGESKLVQGQLRILMDAGMDRVAFLHLGATRPRDGSGNPWLRAAADASRAEDAWDASARLFEEKELPGVGYFRSVFGAVEHATEDRSGAGAQLRCLSPALPNPKTATAARDWRARVAAKLGECPRTPWPAVFVTVCHVCGRWNASGLPTHLRACDCGAPPPG